MNISIQINFFSGLGDFYSYFCEVYFFCKKIKDKNYKIKLFIHTNNKIDFSNLFEKKYYEFFEEIVVIPTPISLKDFDNYTVFYPKNSSTGQQGWDVFVPTDFTYDLPIIRFNLMNPSMEYLELSDFPKFNNSIIEKVNNFLETNELKNFSILHFRDLDDVADVMNVSVKDSEFLQDDLYVRDYYKVKKNFSLPHKIEEKINSIKEKEKKLFICSNNAKIKKYVVEKFGGFIIHEDDIEGLLRRSYSDESYLEHCLIEFCLISKANKIYSFSNYSWVSNFLIYGILHKNGNPINPKIENDFIELCGEFYETRN